VLVKTLLLSLLVAGQVLEVRRRKRSRREKELRGQQRSELHIESRTGSGQVSAIGGLLLMLMLMLVLVLMLVLMLMLRLCVDAGNVTAPRVSISETRDVGSESAM